MCEDAGVAGAKICGATHGLKVHVANAVYFLPHVTPHG
jgi:hypothetical protein